MEAPPDTTEHRDLEVQNILAALHRSDGKICGEDGAALLGMKPTTLTSRIKVLDIKLN